MRGSNVMSVFWKSRYSGENIFGYSRKYALEQEYERQRASLHARSRTDGGQSRTAVGFLRKRWIDWEQELISFIQEETRRTKEKEKAGYRLLCLASQVHATAHHREERQKHSIVRFTYLCQMIGEQSIFLPLFLGWWIPDLIVLDPSDYPGQLPAYLSEQTP